MVPQAFQMLIDKVYNIAILLIMDYRIILIAPCAVEVCYVRKEERGIHSNILNFLHM